MATALDFEKPILEIQSKIEELKKMSLESGMDLNKDIETLEQEAEDFKKELFANLDPTQKMQIARHPERPKFLDYVNLMCTDFVELHGDRVGTDDRAIVGGLAKLDGRPIMIIGTMKGKSTKENLEYVDSLLKKYDLYDFKNYYRSVESHRGRDKGKRKNFCFT